MSTVVNKPVLRALFLVLAAFALCGSSRAVESLRIGFATSNLDDTFLNHVVAEARQAAREHGAILVVEGAGENIETQLRQVRGMLDDGVDAVIVVLADTSQPAGFVDAAKAKKVPLVFVNRNPYADERPPPNCYVIATDAFVEGETQMNYAGGIIGPEGKLFILQGIAATDGARKRTEGVKSVVRSSYPEMAIVAEESANWMRGQARGIVNKWLGSFKEMDAILANNDDMALGALDALAENEREGVTVLGIDAHSEALKAIQSGRLAGSVRQDSALQGRGAVEMALKAVKGETQPQNNILPSELVTRENVDKYIAK